MHTVDDVNVLNWVNLGDPGASLAAPATFGKIRATRNLCNMREVQLGLHFTF